MLHSRAALAASAPCSAPAQSPGDTGSRGRLGDTQPACHLLVGEVVDDPHLDGVALVGR